MKKRSERHLTSEEQEPKITSRADKNKYLYDEINNKIGFEEIINLDNKTKIDLSSINTTPKSRRDYQQIKDYPMIAPTKAEQNLLEEVKQEKKEEKVYDINAVLEEAKKKRTEEAGSLENRRKLQNEEYNVLANLNKKYIDKKEKLNEELEKEGLEELINTITSNSLANEAKEKLEENDSLEEEKEDDGKDLMSDLMATNANLNVKIEEGMIKDLINEEENEEDPDNIVDENGKLVNSFYTRSMDLSEQDFEIKEEIEEENRAKRKILILVVSIILVLLIIVGIVLAKKLNII